MECSHHNVKAVPVWIVGNSLKLHRIPGLSHGTGLLKELDRALSGKADQSPAPYRLGFFKELDLKRRASTGKRILKQYVKAGE